MMDAVVNPKIVIGTMCGTSMNSLDIVAVEFSANDFAIRATATYALPDDYKSRYLKIINNGGSCTLQELGNLNSWTGQVFADAINLFIADYNLQKDSITAIANHGQTIWHAPNSAHPFSMQLGDSNVIAAVTGIKTVSDFRNADIASGGQGAPLAPLFHKAIFSSSSENRCIVNIGGFSNISILENNKFIGFDSGPGNCLLDYWMAEHFQQSYDKNGDISKTGKILPELLASCLSDSYFNKPVPKSTGREHFNVAWLNSHLSKFATSNFTPADVLCTLVAITAESIARAIKDNAHHTTKVYICGGGAYNAALLQMLAVYLEQEPQTTAALGVDPDWVEATLFAWLALQRVSKQAVDLQSITGSQQPVILGAVYQPPQ